MHTERTKFNPIALFLFAHQDDEFGVFQQIQLERSRGRRIVCAYFTSGVKQQQNPSHRNQESLSVLSRFDVHHDDVFFVGERLSISDGQLCAHLQSASQWLESWIDSVSSLASVYVAAWEGGHPDHDSLHAISVQVFSERGLVHLMRQFPLYNRYKCLGLFYRVLFPLSENGAPERTLIPWANRLRFMRHCLSYPSQYKSWIGLFPFVFFHYVLRGYQELQPINAYRIHERPHRGTLYYEKRGFSSWAVLTEHISRWKATRTFNE